jgi:hypothetical protein
MTVKEKGTGIVRKFNRYGTDGKRVEEKKTCK